MMSELTDKLRKIEERVGYLEDNADRIMLNKKVKLPEENLTRDLYWMRWFILFKLDRNIRKTMVNVEKLGEATTYAVSKKTGRSRGRESFYLNRLEKMGYLEKSRRGKDVYFRPVNMLRRRINFY